MARIRSVKPEICESEIMASCSAEVERTFVRLWTHCDDQGRAKDHPQLIKSALFPLHDDVTAETVDAHLSTLAEKGLIDRYEVDGVRYLVVTSWHEHQKPQKPRASKLPGPPPAESSSVQEGSRTSPVAVPDTYGPVVGGVGVEGVGDTHSSLRTTHEPEDASDVQTHRRTAALVGRAIADRSGAGNPAAYAATVTAAILTGDDPTDRDRITAALAAGDTPETIAAGWVPDPLATVLGPIGARRNDTAPARPPIAAFDPARHEAEAEAQRRQLDALEAR